VNPCMKTHTKRFTAIYGGALPLLHFPGSFREVLLRNCLKSPGDEDAQP
jgi:hypothetical protein